MNVNGDVQTGGNLSGTVGGIRVDENDLVEERVPADQGLLDGSNDVANRCFFIEGGQSQTDGHLLLFFELHQAVEVIELIRVIGVLGEPFVYQQGDCPRPGTLAFRTCPLAGMRLAVADHGDRAGSLEEDVFEHRADRAALFKRSG